jgi:hypothetical protein
VDSVGVRIQKLPLGDQVLSLARLAEGRSDTGRFAPADVDALFDEVSLPRPAKVANILLTLEKKGHLKRAKVSGRSPSWQLTPIGRVRSVELTTDMDLAALAAESARRSVTLLADTPHPVIPPSLAPPELLTPLRHFFEEHPFAQNVFGMTRFPGKTESGELDPISDALTVARDVCRRHGLDFHLASDRQIVDDLWANVAAHLWGSQYAIAFYEDRTGKGLNYNLNIEVGSVLVLGRRLAILKDKPIEKLPTDLVSRIFKEVDLTNAATVGDALHRWCRDDLNLGACPACPND